jgi:hypothetical protein
VCSAADFRKINLCKIFLSFLDFQCEASGRARLQRPDGRVRRPDARDLSACFRGSAHPDDVNKPSGQGPHNLYKNRPSHFKSYPTQNLSFGL